MTLAVWFWVILVLSLILGAWNWYAPAPGIRAWGGGLLQLVLFLIIGWAVFGSPVK